MARGAAIAVGIVAVAAVNDLLDAPDSHRRLAVQLAAIHRRLCNYAKTAIREEATDPTTAAELLREITALHSETASLATESASGSIRGAAARSTSVALVAELHAARAVNALRETADPALRALMASALDRRAVNTRQFPRPHGATTLNLDLARSASPLRWAGPSENCCDATRRLEKGSPL